MLIYKRNEHKKIGAISQLGAEKITFPPKPDGETDIQTDRRTDILVDRVALLLKILRCILEVDRLQPYHKHHKVLRHRHLNGVFLNSVLFRNEYFLHEGIKDGAIAHHLFTSIIKKSSIKKMKDSVK